MKATTRQELCEHYGDRWQTNHLSETQWREVLDGLYAGKGARQVVRDLKLNESIVRSLTIHCKEHRGYLAFKRAERLKDKRLMMGATLTDAWESLLERLFTVAMDESTKPGNLAKLAAVVQRDRTELATLADKAMAEFEEGTGTRRPKEVAELGRLTNEQISGLERLFDLDDPDPDAEADAGEGHDG